jgi:hypothetical protein
MQPADKRKNLRRSLTYPAFLDFGDGLPPRECTLCDASQEGAQLTVADVSSLPDEFILALSSDGAARRRCRVIWRTETQIGVLFLRDPKKAARPERVPVTRLGVVELQDGKASAEPPAVREDIDTVAPR